MLNNRGPRTKTKKKMKTEIFSKFFASVWTNETPGPVPTIKVKDIKLPIEESPGKVIRTEIEQDHRTRWSSSHDT